MYDIYQKDHQDRWRYALGRSGSRPLIAIGLNPSTANQEKSDPTVAKVEKAAIQNGFDGFIMLNLYPIRATDYRTLSRRVDSMAFEKNLRTIEQTVSSIARPTIWAAWGASVEYLDYFEAARDELFQRLAKYKVTWLRFGELTTDGHPRHPSRLSYEWKFHPYAVVRPAQ